MLPTPPPHWRQYLAIGIGCRKILHGWFDIDMSYIRIIYWASTSVSIRSLWFVVLLYLAGFCYGTIPKFLCSQQPDVPSTTTTRRPGCAFFFQGFPYKNQGLELTIHVSYQAHVFWTPGNFNISSFLFTPQFGASERCFRTLVNGHQLRLPLIYIPLSTIGIWLSHSVWKKSSVKMVSFSLWTAALNSIRFFTSESFLVEGPDFEKKQGEK